jgi:nitrogen fixation NifU-like protein
MANNTYSKKVIEHFQNPHNYGKMKNPDGVGKVGNPICGDVMHLYIKVEKGIIKDIKYETFGCVAAISTSSVVTDLAKGKTLKQALKIDSNKVVKSLGGLPDIKHHCSLLAVDALKKAINDYLSKKKNEEKK